MKNAKDRSKSPQFYFIKYIWKYIVLTDQDWLIINMKKCFLMWCKSTSSSLFHTIYIEKKHKNKKNFLQGKWMLQKILFFLSQTLSHHSFNFNLWFLHELKHKIHHFFRSLCGILQFWFRLAFTKVSIFVQQKVLTVRLYGSINKKPWIR